MIFLKVAIVEDDEKQYQVIHSLLKEFEETENTTFSVSYFHDGLEFVNKYDGSFDLIFMDIEMPRLDGLGAANKLRAFDKDVPIIIVSHSAKYAVKGYYVHAFGYLVKPIAKTDFVFLLKKVIGEIYRKKDSGLLLESKAGIQKILTKDIVYVEVDNHSLLFHLSNGETLTMRGKMSDYVIRLGKMGFARCNECYLVNLSYVTKIDNAKNLVFLHDISLTISRQKKKNFIEALTNFLGENAQNV